MDENEIEKLVFSILCDNQHPKGKGILVTEFPKVSSLIAEKLTEHSPTIKIDDKALRFQFQDESSNLFWDDLFVGQRSPGFQAEVMRNIMKAYNECVRNVPKNENDFG